MAKKASGAKSSEPVGTRSTASQTSTAKPKIRDAVESVPTKPQKPSALLDTRGVYCGDNLESLAKLPDNCNSAFRTPHSANAATGSFYYHCDWHASHYVKVMLDQISGKN